MTSALSNMIFIPYEIRFSLYGFRIQMHGCFLSSHIAKNNATSNDPLQSNILVGVPWCCIIASVDHESESREIRFPACVRKIAYRFRSCLSPRSNLNNDGNSLYPTSLCPRYQAGCSLMPMRLRALSIRLSSSEKFFIAIIDRAAGGIRTHVPLDGI